MPKVSVLMSVYNGERHLPTCVPNVLNQTLTDFEFVIVNDGSTDRTGEMLDEYAKKDPRIRVYHQQNAGVGPARAEALSHAKGEYVVVIDDDDVLWDNALEENYALAKKHNADIVWFGRHFSYEGDTRPAPTVVAEMKEAVYSKSDFGEAMPHLSWAMFGGFVWDKMFRRALIEEHGISFERSAKFGEEDTLFVLDVFEHAECIVENPKIYYTHYRIMGENIARVYRTDRIPNMLRIITRRAEVYNVHGAEPVHTAKMLKRGAVTLARYIMYKDSPLSRPEKREWLERLNNADAIAALSAKPIKSSFELAFALLKKRRYGLLETFDRIYSLVRKIPHSAAK